MQYPWAIHSNEPRYSTPASQDNFRTYGNYNSARPLGCTFLAGDCLDHHWETKERVSEVSWWNLLSSQNDISIAA